MYTSKAEAIVSYAAENAEEIDFTKGDMILVDETSIADGYIFGQVNGKAGYLKLRCIRILGKG